MSEFVIKKTKPIEIKNEAGEVLVSYSINFGNHENLKKWMSKINDINRISEKLSTGESVIDDLVSLEKEIIQMITNDYEKLWELCEHNVYTMLDLVRFFSEHIREEVEDIKGKYL